MKEDIWNVLAELARDAHPEWDKQQVADFVYGAYRTYLLESAGSPPITRASGQSSPVWSNDQSGSV